MHHLFTEQYINEQQMGEEMDKKQGNSNYTPLYNPTTPPPPPPHFTREGGGGGGEKHTCNATK